MVLYAVLQELSSNNFIPSIQFGTILTIFTKFKYYFDFDQQELCPFPILIEKGRVHQLLWCEKSQSS